MQNNRSAIVYEMTSQKQQQQNSLSLLVGRDHGDKKNERYKIMFSLLRCISQFSVDKSLKQSLSCETSKLSDWVI